MSGSFWNCNNSGVAAMLAALALLAIGSGVARANPNAGPLPPVGNLPQTATEIDPAQAYQQGLAAFKAGDYRTAEQMFGEVLRVARNNPDANYYMGLTKVARGKEKSSVRYFKRAIAERPDLIEARENLAIVLVGLDRPEEAREQLTALKEIKQDCADASCDADYMASTEKAIAAVEAALSGAKAKGEDVSLAPAVAPRLALLSSDGPEAGPVRYNAAVKLINQERYGAAIADLYRAQAAYGPHPDILNYLGYAHRKAGDFETAQKYYAQALSLDPDHRGATEYLGELYLELGDIKKAKKQLARLDRICVFACPEREDLARLIATKESVRNARR